MESKKSFITPVILALLIGWVTSCTQVDISMPKGPKGDPGLSAYDFWKEKVTDGTIEWPKDQVAVTDYFKYLKGKDGKDGKDGKGTYDMWKEQIASGNVDDPHNPGMKWSSNKNSLSDFWFFLTGASGENGQTPHVGNNGNWFIGTHDTGTPARGKDGKDARPPVVTIGRNGNWFINGTDTGRPSQGADGENGKTPTVTIGDNGNWFIDGRDTQKPARGEDGQSPEVLIGNNGNWWINGKDTGKPAYGTPGTPGKSAYALWKESVEKGCLPGGTAVMNPHNPTQVWDCNKTSQADFWEYLRGADGKSAYDVWKEKVADGTIAWPKDQVGEADFFKYLKGKKGDNAYEVWKEQIASGNVDDPHSPGNKWDPNKNTLADFWRFLTGAKGEDGKTPVIGDNGNWWIDGKDTGKPARGESGTSPVIGSNGNWWIDGKDTGKPAQGIPGKSAYQLWKEEVEAGCNGGTPVMNPKKPTQRWDCNRTSLADFWEYLRGADGKDGQDGQDGQDGEPGETIIIGAPNVLPTYYNGRMKEFIDPKDGSVTFQVYTELGDKAPLGTIVKGLPGMNPNETFRTNADGKFTIPANKLPDKKDLNIRKGITASVTINGIEKPSAPNTTVPNRINTRINMKFAYLRQALHSSWTRGEAMNNFTIIRYEYERQVDGLWELYPEGLPMATLKTIRVVDPSLPVDAGNIVDNPEAASWGRESLVYGHQTYRKPITGRIMIIRPVVLTPEEESGTPLPLTSGGSWIEKQYRDNKKYKWNNQDNYFSVQGIEYFYGQNPIMPTAVHVPEIYPLAGIKDPKIEIRDDGITYMWGKINLDDLNKFYLKYTEPAKLSDKWVAEVADKSQLHENIFFGVGMTKATSSGGGGSTTINVQVKKFSTKENFVLDSTYPNNYLGFYCYLEDSKGRFTLGAPNDFLADDVFFCPYRDGGFFYFKREGSGSSATYHFENYYDKTKKVNVPRDVVPVNWMKK